MAGLDDALACLWALAEIVGSKRTQDRGIYRADSEAPVAPRNGVFHASLGADAEERIDQVIEHFAARGVPFRWHVGPACLPSDLGDRLLAKGFRHVDTLAGMRSRTDRAVAELDPAIRIEPLSPGDESTFVDVVLGGFEAPPSRRATILASVTDPDPRQAHYTAWMNDTMVGVATSARLAHAGFLQGATVLPTHRGRGIYRQLIQTRLTDFHRAGIAEAIITARTATSAPICDRLGFERISTIDVFEHD